MKPTIDTDNSLEAAMAAYDATIKACPANKQFLGDKLCPKCGAGPSEGCRRQISATFAVTEAARAALQSQTIEASPAATVQEVGRDEYRRGVYDAKCWLRDQQHKNPPDSLWHAAAILADRMDVALLSASPSKAVEPAPEQGPVAWIWHHRHAGRTIVFRPLEDEDRKVGFGYETPLYAHPSPAPQQSQTIYWRGTEDQQHDERMKACRARREAYPDDECEQDGSCAECTHDMIEALRITEAEYDEWTR